MRGAAALVGLTAVGLVVAVVVGLGRPADVDDRDPDPGRVPVQAAGLGLVPFDACEPLLDHLRTAAARDPWGVGGGMVVEDMQVVQEQAVAADGADAAGAARMTGTSDTNVQVAGVDEPDLTETDGRRLFTVTDRQLHVLDVSGPVPRRLSSTPLEVDGGESQLVLHDGRLLVVTPRWGGIAGGGVAADIARPEAPVTTVALYDVRDDDPGLVGRLDVDGHHVAGRAVDGTAHLVVAHRPNPLPVDAMEPVWQARSEDEARTHLQSALADTNPGDWLPQLAHRAPDGVVTTGQTVGCTDVARTAGEQGTGTLQVLTLDMHGADALPEDTTGVMTDARTVTATADQLVVATPVWPALDQPTVDGDVAPQFEDTEPTQRLLPAPDQPATTRLHLFDLDTGGATHRASGQAPGTLLNQFSMSLHDGHLRVATTAGEPWMGDSESGVTVLRPDGDRLEVVGQVGGLGRGETIHSVRFLGDRGYVVTFRQTDPLYTLDLSDPEAPSVTGELKITGYSAYLHPLADDRLLGVGQEATLEGRTTGTQVSVFDVSDPSDPRRESQVLLPGAHSEGEVDHHAVLVHDDTLVLPYERWSEPTAERPQGYEAGAVVVALGGPRLEHVGTLKPDVGDGQGGIRRAVVVDGRILTVSGDGVDAWDGTSLEQTGSLRW